MHLTVSDILSFDYFRDLRLVAGQGGLGREVSVSIFPGHPGGGRGGGGGGGRSAAAAFWTTSWRPT